MDSSLSSQQLVEAVLASFESTPDERLREIIKSLVSHLHQFVADVKLSHEEWQKGIEFLTAVGKKCSPERQEFMLLSDVLGVSSAVDVTNDNDPSATPGTVLGPYYIADSPRRPPGASLIDTDDGGPHLDRVVAVGDKSRQHYDPRENRKRRDPPTPRLAFRTVSIQGHVEKSASFNVSFRRCGSSEIHA